MSGGIPEKKFQAHSPCGWGTRLEIEFYQVENTYIGGMDIPKLRNF